MALRHTQQQQVGHHLALADLLLEGVSNALGYAAQAADEDTVAQLAELAETIDQIREALGGIGP